MTVYHLAQKTVPATVHPFAALTVTYAAALAGSLAALAGSARSGIPAELAKVTWVSLALGLGVVALEFGGLMAYRRGWSVGTFGLVFNALTALILLPIGYVFFRERLSPPQWAGAALCLAGLGLLAKR